MRTECVLRWEPDDKIAGTLNQKRVTCTEEIANLSLYIDLLENQLFELRGEGNQKSADSISAARHKNTALVIENCAICARNTKKDGQYRSFMTKALPIFVVLLGLFLVF